MNWPMLLDVLLFVLGLLALSPRLLGRNRRTAAVLAFSLGLAMIAAAGVDVGLVAWEKAHRPNYRDQGAAFEKRLAAHRSEQEFVRQKALGPVEAPDFCLPSLDEGRSVRLSDFREHKPVVLIFGSFGCDIFCKHMVHVRRLHEKYGSLAQFLLVYISEAPHELPAELRSFAEPPGSPPGSRLRLLPRARAGRELFDLRFPCLIDNEKCEAEILYNAYPSRLIIVDSAGHIALESSFHPWEEVADWLARYAASSSAHPAGPS